MAASVNTDYNQIMLKIILERDEFQPEKLIDIDNEILTKIIRSCQGISNCYETSLKPEKQIKLNFNVPVFQRVWPIAQDLFQDNEKRTVVLKKINKKDKDLGRLFKAAQKRYTFQQGFSSFSIEGFKTIGDSDLYL